MLARGLGYALLTGLAGLVVVALASVSSLAPGVATPAGRQASSLVARPYDQHFVASTHRAGAAEVEVHSLFFPQAPGLTATVQKTLLSMAPAADTGPGGRLAAPQTFARFAQRLFEASARTQRTTAGSAPYTARLTARVVDRHDGLTVLRLDTDLFLGGAHDVTATTYQVIDDASHRVLGLDDMLVAGRKSAFWNVLAAAHRRWRATADLDADAWPFVVCANAAPLRGGLVVTYPADAIAPDYFGEPDIHIAYDALRGILRPRFMPTARH